MITDAINQSLINNYQHTFPLVSEPFANLARQLETDVVSVLKRVKALKKNGTISRIGPVFRPNTVGVSTLAAIAVPEQKIDYYAEIINGFRQVNHNYQREHDINLWFVLTAANQFELDVTISEIENQTGQSVLVLPMLKEYHIDLGFSLTHLNQNHRFSDKTRIKQPEKPQAITPNEFASAKELIAAVQGGLPLVEKPYQALADQLNKSEAEVITELKQLIDQGAIKRFGVVVRHHEVGYRANAMVVWDVPDDEVDLVGEALGAEGCVTLCYQRPRVLPRWPYNLFCMIHGKDRDEVLSCIERLRSDHKLAGVPQQTLFSGKRFKQRGAHYQLANPQREEGLREFPPELRLIKTA